MWYWRKSEWLNFANAITALYWEGGLWGAPAAVLTVWGFQLPSPWRKRSPNICPQCGYSYPQEDKLESSWGKTMKKKEDRGVEKKKRAQDGSRVHFPGGSTRAQGNCSFRGVGLGGVVYGGLDAAPRARDYTYFSIEEGRSYSSQVVLFYQKRKKAKQHHDHSSSLFCLKQSRTLSLVLVHTCPQSAFCLWKNFSQRISLIREMRTHGNKGKQSK